MAQRWEVDPESKSKLSSLQSLPPNKTCIDCSAPSPQWASPKFGTFICLTCAGLHRSLGVHISFVRSVAMDSFKASEVQRMEQGGNKNWRSFWEERNPGKTWAFPGKGGDEAAKRRIEETYGSEVGEEYKERLSCKVEGREFAGVPEKPKKKDAMGGMGAPSHAAGALAGGGSTQKQKNENYFARKGAENASKPDGVKPSEGGKYGGFGGGMPRDESAHGDAAPGVQDFQNDPIKALGKGWGWFSGQAAKVGKGVVEGGGFAVQKIAEADLASQARSAAAAASKGIQSGTQNATRSFNQFVEGDNPTSNNSARGVEPEKKDFWDNFGERKEPERKDFWDSFGEEKEGSGSGSVGSKAIKKGGGEGNGGSGKKGEGWDSW